MDNSFSELSLEECRNFLDELPNVDKESFSAYLNEEEMESQMKSLSNCNGTMLLKTLTLALSTVMHSHEEAGTFVSFDLLHFFLYFALQIRVRRFVFLFVFLRVKEHHLSVVVVPIFLCFLVQKFPSSLLLCFLPLQQLLLRKQKERVYFFLLFWMIFYVINQRSFIILIALKSFHYLEICLLIFLDFVTLTNEQVSFSSFSCCLLAFLHS
jgi:hypothetical protein